MKVIFLDVDGVLNYVGCDSSYGGLYFVDEEKLRMLADLVERTNAKIVLTSTWRHGFVDLLNGEETFEADLYQALAEALEEHNLSIYDCTGEEEENRGAEIETWITSIEEPLGAFVILDDMGIEQFGEYGKYLVQTNINTGLEVHHIDQAIQILTENDANEAFTELYKDENETLLTMFCASLISSACIKNERDCLDHMKTLQKFKAFIENQPDSEKKRKRAAFIKKAEDILNESLDYFRRN